MFKKEDVLERKVKLETEADALEKELISLARKTSKDTREERKAIRKKLGVIQAQITTLETFEAAWGNIAELGDKLPELDVVMGHVKDSVDGVVAKGKGMLQFLKGKVLDALDGGEIDEQKKHHFAAVISLLNAKRRDSAIMELRQLESEAGLPPAAGEQLDRTINLVEKFLKDGNEEAALTVLGLLYAQKV